MVTPEAKLKFIREIWNSEKLYLLPTQEQTDKKFADGEYLEARRLRERRADVLKRLVYIMKNRGMISQKTGWLDVRIEKYIEVVRAEHDQVIEKIV